MVACGGGMRAGMCAPVWSSVRPGCGAVQPAICVCVACSVCAVVRFRSRCRSGRARCVKQARAGLCAWFSRRVEAVCYAELGRVGDGLWGGLWPRRRDALGARARRTHHGVGVGFQKRFPRAQ